MRDQEEKPLRSVKARLKLYWGPGKRTLPIYSGYRPTFWTISESGANGIGGSGRTSGKIDILEADTIQPGEETLVTITFVTEEILGADFGAGSVVYFAEGREVLGEASVIEVL